MNRRWLGLGLGVLAGCTGIIESFTPDAIPVDAMPIPDAAPPDACVPPVGDLPPAKPSVLTPAGVSGKPTLLDPAAISITATPFSDPDAADAFAGADVEILAEENGQPTSVVWRAHITDAAKLASGVTLADGEFVFTELFPWTDYFVRVRYSSTRLPCSDASAYSDPVLFKTDDNSAYLFDDSTVREIRLYITEPSWSSINAQAIVQGGCVPWQRDYYTADLVFEGIRYNGVGAHVKGGCGSDRDLDHKASFKIGLKWDDPALEGCSANARLLGQTHLTLNNGVQDCSHEHEKLAYKMYAAMGVPVPRQAHVRLYVNDEYWGVYLNLESFDRRMMTRVFGDDRGMLYEGTYGCDMSAGDIENDITSERCDTEFTQDVCDDPPEPGQDPTDFEALRTLVAQLDAIPAGQFYPDAGQYVDLDEWLALWATNAAIDHWDDTFRGGNNYRIYHDVASGKWKLLSSGVDQTFARELFRWWREINHTFAAKCFSERDCIDAFEAKLDLATGYLVSLNLGTYADDLHERLRPYAEIDTRRECDNATWDQRHLDMKNWVAARPGRLPMFRKSDAFQADLSSTWTTGGAATATVAVAGGQLRINQTTVGRYDAAGPAVGKFVYKTLTGDFRVTVRARAERESGGKTDQDNTWAGALMLNPGGDDWVFVGTGRLNSGTSKLIRVVTTNNAPTNDSSQDDPGDDSVTDLRICRVGTTVQVLKFDSGSDNRWELVGTQFTQPADFGATVQVGMASSAGDVTPTFRAHFDFIDFYPATSLNDCAAN